MRKLLAWSILGIVMLWLVPGEAVMVLGVGAAFCWAAYEVARK